MFTTITRFVQDIPVYICIYNRIITRTPMLTFLYYVPPIHTSISARLPTMIIIFFINISFNKFHYGARAFPLRRINYYTKYTHTHIYLQTHTHNSNYTLLTTSIDDDFPIASAHAVRNSDYRFLFGRYVFKYCI